VRGFALILLAPNVRVVLHVGEVSADLDRITALYDPAVSKASTVNSSPPFEVGIRGVVAAETGPC